MKEPGGSLTLVLSSRLAAHEASILWLASCRESVRNCLRALAVLSTDISRTRVAAGPPTGPFVRVTRRVAEVLEALTRLRHDTLHELMTLRGMDTEGATRPPSSSQIGPVRDDGRRWSAAALLVEVSVTLHAASYALAPAMTTTTYGPEGQAPGTAVDTCRRFLSLSEGAVDQLLELTRATPGDRHGGRYPRPGLA